MSGFKLRSREWQAGILTTVLHRPLKNILFANTHERKRNPIPNFVVGEQTQIIRFTTAEFRIQLKLTKIKFKSSLRGDQTGGSTHHSTRTTFEKLSYLLTHQISSIAVTESNPILNPIKIVKTRLNLLLSGIKVGSLERQAGMLTLVLQRPLEHNNSSDKRKYSPLYHCNDLWTHIIC